MNKSYLLTIKAEDRPGLLHLITGHLNRKLIPIFSLTAAPTGIDSVMLISIEILISDRALTPLILKLENIIEVFAVDAQVIDQAITMRCTIYSLRKDFLVTAAAMELGKHQAKVINIAPEIVTVAHSGCEAEIRRLHAVLNGPNLLGFSQSAPICDNRLLAHEEESSVISRLAA